MKHIISLLIIVTSITTNSFEAQAQHSKPLILGKDKYEKALKDFTIWSEKLTDPDSYEKFAWKAEDVEKKFSDLSELEKDQFYIVQGFQLTKELHILATAWKNEIFWINSGKLPKLPEFAATADEILAFQKQLLDLRKKTAIKFEDIIDKTFEKHKANISEKEKDFIKKQIVVFHDKNKLIERKDDSK